MSQYYGNLSADNIYHVYSRAVGKEKLFVTDDNYRFFLNRFQLHVLPVADLLCWCLLPNHFHFLIRIKSEAEIQQQYVLKKRSPYQIEYIPDFLMERFSNFLNSYTKSFNKVYNRHGSLFTDYMKRVEVKLDEQFGATLFYIHKNPVHHGYCKAIGDWYWSSYKTFLSVADTLIDRNTVLDWFQGKDQFVAFHKQPVSLKHYVPIE